MKTKISLIALALLAAIASCKKPEPVNPPQEEETVEVLGTDYYSMCEELIGMNPSEMNNFFVAHWYSCTNSNQTTPEECNYVYEYREGSVTSVCAVVVRNDRVVGVTAGEQWDYGYGQCADMRDRYLSLVRLSELRNRPLGQMSAAVNGTPYSTVEDYANALESIEIPENCMNGQRIETSMSFLGSKYEVRGNADIKNEQFLSWYTGPSYTITIFSE